MVILTNCSLASDTQDFIIKHVHSEKYSDVNKRVVAVFVVTVFSIVGTDYLKFYAVL